MAVTPIPVARHSIHPHVARWFALWALVGAGGSLGILGVLTIGIALLPVTLIALALLVRHGTRNDQVWRGLGGLGAGMAAPLLLVAYLNRRGAGTVCTTHRDSVSCVDEWSPWPFLAIAAFLISASIVGTVLLNRRPRPSGSPTQPTANR